MDSDRLAHASSPAIQAQRPSRSPEGASRSPDPLRDVYRSPTRSQQDVMERAIGLSRAELRSPFRTEEQEADPVYTVEGAGPSTSRRSPRTRQRPEQEVVDLTAPSPPLPRPTVVSSSGSSGRASSSAASSRRTTPSWAEGFPSADVGIGRRQSPRLQDLRGSASRAHVGYRSGSAASSVRAARIPGIVLPGSATDRPDALQTQRSRGMTHIRERMPPRERPNAEPIVLEISSEDDEAVRPSAPSSSSSRLHSTRTEAPVDVDEAPGGVAAGEDEEWIEVIRARRRRANRDPNPLNIRSPPPQAGRHTIRNIDGVASGSRAVGISVDPVTGDYLPFRGPGWSSSQRRMSGSDTDSDGVIDLSAPSQAAPSVHSITDYRIRNTNLALPRISPPRSKPPPIQHPLASTLTCPICLCPPVKTSITPCGHVFCGGCLFDALKAQAKQRQANGAYVAGSGWGWHSFAGPVGGGAGLANDSAGSRDADGTSGLPNGSRSGGTAATTEDGRTGRSRSARDDPLAGHCPVCRAHIKGGFKGIAKGGIVGMRLMIGKPADDPRQEDGRLKGSPEPQEACTSSQDFDLDDSASTGLLPDDSAVSFSMQSSSGCQLQDSGHEILELGEGASTSYRSDKKAGKRKQLSDPTPPSLSAAPRKRRRSPSNRSNDPASTRSGDVAPHSWPGLDSGSGPSALSDEDSRLHRHSRLASSSSVSPKSRRRTSDEDPVSSGQGRKALQRQRTVSHDTSVIALEPVEEEGAAASGWSAASGFVS